MLVALLRTLRPKQWTKNTFVFAALVFDRQLMNPTAFLRTAAGFLLFCLLSGMVYLINDLADLEADRQHPTKRHRPLASGRLPVPVALVGLGVLFLITFPAAWALGRGFCLVALGYFLLNLAYSFALKHIPLIDVLAIAAGFLLRVQAGVSLIHVQRFSPWLYVVTSLLALFLGFGKRRAELSLLAAGAGAHRRV
ncbi:MAG TPA: decaprenyl-phosphate phosphoribosyltransferase, partial [Anaerolineaceae bacterium]|nr:decaprenyl-phosphate phosphoribosyltransferase [Anaerolineaceae bacterium]